MFTRAVAAMLVVAAPALRAQAPAKPVAYRVSTYAGIPWTTAGPAKAPNVMLKTPFGVVYDQAGNLYIANYEMHLVRRITPGGDVTTVAGDGVDSRTLVFGGDPAAAARRLTFPRMLAVDANRFLYIGEPVVARIRRVNLENGAVDTIVGGRGPGFSPDGTQGTEARINEVLGLAVDAQGGLLIAETGSHRIRRWSAATGLLTTIAGNGTAGFAGDDGPATAARLNRPAGIAVHPSGDIYFFDFENRRVRRIRGGNIATVAGIPTGTVTSGPGAQVNFGASTGIALDREGRNLYITSENQHRTFKLQLSDMTVTVASGTGVAGRSAEDISAAQATYSTPTNVAVDPLGGVVVADSHNHRIRRIGTDGLVRTIAGLTRFAQQGSTTLENTVFDGITAIRVDSRGGLLVSEVSHCMIRSVAGDSVSLVAGTQGACQAALNSVSSAVLDNDRNLFYLTRQGLFFRPVAGGAAALRTNLTGSALTLSRDGNRLYYLNSSEGHVYSVDRTTALTASAIPLLLAGRPGRGDPVDGPAETARFLFPSDLAETVSGDLLIADSTQVRRLSRGQVSSINAQLPASNVAVDSAGAAWISSRGRIGRLGQEGGLDQLIGPLSFEFELSPDGAAGLAVRFRGTPVIAAGRDGVIYIADVGNNVIRRAVPVQIESYTKVEGDGQAAEPGASLTTPLRVRVMGADGDPLSGVAISFTAPHLAQAVTAVTDMQGLASFARMPLPLTPGRVTVTATTATIPQLTVTFTATAGAAAPSITSVAVVPEYGGGSQIAGGSHVEIRGALLTGGQVTMNDLPATVISTSADRIVCVVPESLPAGPVTIAVTPEGGASGEGFTFEAVERAPALLAPPDLRSEGKQFVQVEADGRKLSFTATGLGATPSDVKIQFGEGEPVTAELTAGAPGTYRVTATVPDAITGDTAVKITAGAISGSQELWTKVN